MKGKHFKANEQKTILSSMLKNKNIDMENDIYDYAIQIMRKKRIELEWTQTELSYHTINMSRSFIRDVENPKRREKLNLSHINQLSKAFNCSPKDFLPTEPL
jgi:ribosome-binding protein aMBF1 (putative translation factor)